MKNNKFFPKIEQESPSKIKAFQEELLKKQLAYLYANSKFYQSHFNKNGVEINEINKIEDLQKIPPIGKNELNRYNHDFLCVSEEKIIDYITTSGTMGDPVTFAMTDKDLDRLAYNEALGFVCSNCGSGDIIQLTTTIDKRFMAGLAYFLGARMLGAGIIRVGAGIPELQWDSIFRMKPSTLVAVPSFILKLISYAEQKGIDYKNSSIKRVICIGEALRKTDFTLSKLSERILEKWDIKLYSTFASTEMATAFSECSEGHGGHLHPELIIAEFLDENDNVVPEGEEGELTITHLGMEGMPLLRFKTGDICKAHLEPCDCGRNTMRIGPVVGRKNQMIKFKGTTIYPPALYDILDEIEMIESYVVRVYKNAIDTDDIEIIANCPHFNSKIEKKIKDHFRAKLRVSPSLRFVSAKEVDAIRFPESARKAVVFIDERE